MAHLHQSLSLSHHLHQSLSLSLKSVTAPSLSRFKLSSVRRRRFSGNDVCLSPPFANGRPQKVAIWRFFAAAVRLSLVNQSHVSGGTRNSTCYAATVLVVRIATGLSIFSIFSNINWKDGGAFLCWTGVVAAIATVVIREIVSGRACVAVRWIGQKLAPLFPQAWVVGGWIIEKFAEVGSWTNEKRICIKKKIAGVRTSFGRLFARANPAGLHIGSRLPVMDK